MSALWTSSHSLEPLASQGLDLGIHGAAPTPPWAQSAYSLESSTPAGWGSGALQAATSAAQAAEDVRAAGFRLGVCALLRNLWLHRLAQTLCGARRRLAQAALGRWHRSAMRSRWEELRSAAESSARERAEEMLSEYARQSAQLRQQWHREREEVVASEGRDKGCHIEVSSEGLVRLKAIDQQRRAELAELHRQHSEAAEGHAAESRRRLSACRRASRELAARALGGLGGGSGGEELKWVRNDRDINLLQWAFAQQPEVWMVPFPPVASLDHATLLDRQRDALAGELRRVLESASELRRWARHEACPPAGTARRQRRAVPLGARLLGSAARKALARQALWALLRLVPPPRASQSPQRRLGPDAAAQVSPEGRFPVLPVHVAAGALGGPCARVPDHRPLGERAPSAAHQHHQHEGYDALGTFILGEALDDRGARRRLSTKQSVWFPEDGSIFSPISAASPEGDAASPGRSSQRWSTLKSPVSGEGAASPSRVAQRRATDSAGGRSSGSDAGAHGAPEEAGSTAGAAQPGGGVEPRRSHLGRRKARTSDELMSDLLPSRRGTLDAAEPRPPAFGLQPSSRRPTGASSEASWQAAGEDGPAAVSATSPGRRRRTDGLRELAGRGDRPGGRFPAALGTSGSTPTPRSAAAGEPPEEPPMDEGQPRLTLEQELGLTMDLVEALSEDDELRGSNRT
ncbi:unnamed protein product [Prorocentrum cordatum]|uniref:Uncharacterized protein n=1 Tax=Prorocentrum cordatum TaxID=2364126 RepID=A0ABN9XP98_9DINO|nr:unnamed protein product [Polarella glacialis]